MRRQWHNGVSLTTQATGKRRRSRWRTFRPFVEALEDRTLPDAAAVPGYGQLPLSFEPNQGQTAAGVDFVAHGNGYVLGLAAGQAVLGLQPPASGSSTAAAPVVVGMSLVGASAAPAAAGQDPLPGVSNYLVGNDPSQWHTNIPTFGAVQYQGVYPGVNLVYHGNQQQLEYDFDVAPGADPSAIRVQFTGADSLSLDAAGNLVIGAGGSTVQMNSPVVYQTIAGVRQDVAGSFLLLGQDQVGFQVGAYDHTQPLVIDPTVVYGSYLGGTDLDFGDGITVDKSGAAYVVGTSLSADFPIGHNVKLKRDASGKPSGFSFDDQNVAGPSFLPPGDLGSKAFVAKVAPDGRSLVYSTFLGGQVSAESGVALALHGIETKGLGIAIDAKGEAYVTGKTNTTDFPVTASALQGQTTSGGGYLAKLNANGTALLYSTYLPGTEVGNGIAVDTNGNAYVTGDSVLGFSATAYHGTDPAKATGAYVVKINPQLSGSSSLVYSALIGNTNAVTEGTAIAVDNQGQAFITGGAGGPGAGDVLKAIATGPQKAYGGGGVTGNNTSIGDAIVVGLKPDGSGPVFATYLGGSGNDEGTGIRVDGSGNVYVVGTTASTDFGTAAVRKAAGGVLDAFVAKINTATSQYGYFTFLGGSSDDYGFAIAVDSQGNAYVAGQTTSRDFPTRLPLPNGGKLVAGTEGFVTRLDPAGHITFSTYLGGTVANPSSQPPVAATVWATGVFADDSGNVYVTGATAAADFPASPAANPTFQGVNLSASTTGPGFNAYVVKLNTGGGRLVVNSTGDLGADTNPDGSFSDIGLQGFTGGFIRTDSGQFAQEVTLRSALQAANAASAPMEIDFAIPERDLNFQTSTGTFLIQPGSKLPTLTGDIILNATTQKEFQGKPVVEIDGEKAGPDANGLVLGHDNTVEGLVINRFGKHQDKYGDFANLVSGLPADTAGNPSDTLTGDGAAQKANGIVLEGPNNTIFGNYIGTDVTGQSRINGSDATTRPGNRLNGILVLSSGNTIGGPSASDRNLIAGNDLNGILIVGDAAVENTVAGNSIGDPTATNNAAPFVEGVLSGLTLPVNTLGQPIDGQHPVQFPLAAGVLLRDTSGNTVGGIGEGNVISGNQATVIKFSGFMPPSTQFGTMAGVVLDNATGAVIAGNLIGLDPTGALADGNTGDGIYIHGGFDNTVGGTAAGARNVIAANGSGAAAPTDIGDFGILIQESNNNTVQGNYIGTDASGRSGADADKVQLGNNGAGIKLFGTSGDQIGGSRSAGAGNVISGNSPFPKIGPDGKGIVSRLVIDTLGGIVVEEEQGGPGGNPDQIQGNSISSNTGPGIVVTQPGVVPPLPSEHTTVLVGGATPDLGNVIALNADQGIVVGGSPTEQIFGVTILSNDIHDNGRHPDQAIQLSDGLHTLTNPFASRIGIDLGNDGFNAPNVYKPLSLTPQGRVGANRGLFTAVLAPATVVNVGTEISVHGRLVAASFSHYLLQFFMTFVDQFGKPAGDMQYLGSADVKTGITGTYEFLDQQFPDPKSFFLNQPVDNGFRFRIPGGETLPPDPEDAPHIVATVTDDQGDTSEFSQDHATLADLKDPTQFGQLFYDPDRKQFFTFEPDSLGNFTGQRKYLTTINVVTEATNNEAVDGIVPGDPTYEMTFEYPDNLPSPAKTATLSTTLDPNLDLSTFSLGQMGFGPTTVQPPLGSTSFHTQVDLTAELGVLVQVDAGLNTTTRVATWTFTALDPTTKQPTTDPNLGFLFPDTNGLDGIIFADYSVSTLATLKSGDHVSSQGQVQFDNLPPLPNTVRVQTIDADPPISTVAPLPAVTNFPSFTVSWSGADNPGGSGIHHFDVFVSDNGGPFTPLVTGTTATSTTFNGQFGHTYGFYSIATDNVGNVQATPAAAQATTTLLPPAVQTVSAVDPSQLVAGGGGASSDPVMSADGRYVAFVSDSRNLSPLASDGHFNVYRYDKQTGTLSLVSTNVAGTAGANGNSGVSGGVGPTLAMSGDGRFVAFISAASNLVPNFVQGGSGSKNNVFVRDMQTGLTMLASPSAFGGGSGNEGVQTDFGSGITGVSISGNGQFVAFGSNATDLVSGVQLNGGYNLFVRDLVHNTTIAADPVASGNSAVGFGSTAVPAVFSADGQTLVFAAAYPNLLPGKTLNNFNVYALDLSADSLSLVSVNQAGTGSGNAESGASGSVSDVAVSADGKLVAFESSATDLVATPTNGQTNVFLRDLAHNTTTLVSVNRAGTAGGAGSSILPVISGNDQFVAFQSTADDLTANDGNGHEDVFVRDLAHNTTTLVSVKPSGQAGNSDSGARNLVTGPVAISADGSQVAFVSLATDLAPNTPAGLPNVFVRNLTTQATTLETAGARAAAGFSTSVNLSDFLSAPLLSSDGQVVAFASKELGLVPRDGDGQSQVFLRDRSAGSTTLVSQRDNNLPSFTAGGSSEVLAVSADGRFVVFVSTATGLTPLDNGGQPQIYLRDLQTGATQMVSVNAAGTAGANGLTAGPAAVSADGRFVAFVSPATDLVANFADGHATDAFDPDVYVRDMVTGQTKLVSVNKAGTASGNAGSGFDSLGSGLAISADGSQVVFASDAGDLVSNPLPVGGVNLYDRNLQTGTTTLVTVRTNGAGLVGEAALTGSAITPDGRFVLFETSDAGLTAQPVNGFATNVFVRDLQAGTTTLVSVTPGGAGGDGDSGPATITPDGRFVAFQSAATNLTAQTVKGGGVYLRDLQSGTTQLIAAGGSAPSISADGSRVVYRAGNQVFVDDLTANKTSLVSASTTGGNGNGTSDLASISPDGQFVAFHSTAANLTTVPAAGAGQVYLRDLGVGSTTLLSSNAAGTAGANGGAGLARIGGDTGVLVSADGSTVVFDSIATDLVANSFAGGNDNPAENVFAVRRLTQPEGVPSTLNGTIRDANGNGVPDVLVFLDLNNNGMFEPGEPSTTTDASGQYTFTDVAPGTYTVAEVVPPGFSGSGAAPRVARFSVLIPSPGLPIAGLDFTNTPADDVAVGIQASPGTVSGPSEITYTITVTNNGTGTATGVTLTDPLPANVVLDTVAGPGTPSVSNGTVTLALGSLASGGQDTITINVRPTAVGTVTNAVQITADGVDPNPNNDSGSATTTVTGTFPGFFAFSGPTFTAHEADGTATITVTRVGTDGTATVDYATADGSATAGTDYTTAKGTLTFGPGVPSQSFTIPILDDGGSGESDQTVNLALGNPTGGSDLGDQNTAVLTISEASPTASPGQVQFGQATFNANEADGTASITLTRTGGSTGAASVQVTAADGSATMGTDYTFTPQTVTWMDGDAAAKTVTVGLLDDGGSGEGTQSLTLSLGTPTGATAGTQASATLAIAEDSDVAAVPPSSSVAALPATEASANFTVSWSGTPGTGATGIASFDVFVSDNGGSFTAFETATAQMSATFHGVAGHAYGFFSVATDNLGAAQPPPTRAQATTTVASPTPPSGTTAMATSTAHAAAGPPAGPTARLVGDSLVVVGGAGDEVILFLKRPKGRVAVVVNGTLLGTFRAKAIRAVGGPGNDLIAVDRRLKLPAFLFGGAGNDVLVGGGGFNFLDGGPGVNTLFPGPRRNVLIGGGPGSGVVIVGGPRGSIIKVRRRGGRVPLLVVDENGRKQADPILAVSRVTVVGGGAGNILLAEASLRGAWQVALVGGPRQNLLIDRTGSAVLEGSGNTSLLDGTGGDRLVNGLDVRSIADPAALGLVVDLLFMEDQRLR